MLPWELSWMDTSTETILPNSFRLDSSALAVEKHLLQELNWTDTSTRAISPFEFPLLILANNSIPVLTIEPKGSCLMLATTSTTAICEKCNYWIVPKRGDSKNCRNLCETFLLYRKLATASWSMLFVWLLNWNINILIANLSPHWSHRNTKLVWAKSDNWCGCCRGGSTAHSQSRKPYHTRHNATRIWLSWQEYSWIIVTSRPGGGELWGRRSGRRRRSIRIQSRQATVSMTHSAILWEWCHSRVTTRRPIRSRPGVTWQFCSGAYLETDDRQQTDFCLSRAAGERLIITGHVSGWDSSDIGIWK